MIYYMQPPSDECMATIRQGFVPGLSQDGPGVDEVVMQAIPKLVEIGQMVLYHEGPIVYMLRRKSAWVGMVDIFIGDGGTIHDAIRVGRSAIAWASENTYYHRLEARSPFAAMPVLAKRLGFVVEGYREQSFMLQDGTMLDEVEVGLILRRTPCHKLH